VGRLSELNDRGGDSAMMVIGGVILFLIRPLMSFMLALFFLLIGFYFKLKNATIDRLISLKISVSIFALFTLTVSISFGLLYLLNISHNTCRELLSFLRTSFLCQ
jgi:hypothetical protein